LQNTPQLAAKRGGNPGGFHGLRWLTFFLPVVPRALDQRTGEEKTIGFGYKKCCQ